jgi:hypothetical protein
VVTIDDWSKCEFGDGLVRTSQYGSNSSDFVLYNRPVVSLVPGGWTELMTKSELQQLKKCVSFIFTPQEGNLTPRGTGFFVGLPLENRDNLPEGVSYSGEVVHPYFVTAKHVLQDTRGEYLEKIAVRVNKRDGGF